jgi:two-component system, NtrC family, nitrogen regulation response regulator GlnG
LVHSFSLPAQNPPGQPPPDEPALIAVSPVMQELLATLRRYAASDATVLIEGETGSGKELAARAIHNHSLVARGPWVDINCAALPDHLAESELFGYEKGAFSGADRAKPGLFELADGGTLFLDEVGELAPQLQGKLLRVLDRMEYFRLGGTRRVRVQTRVVAATNRNLGREMARGEFRADLYHRLSAIRIEVPPLRARIEDLAPLAQALLAQLAPSKCFDPQVLPLLARYAWPGNVRELRNILQRAVALAPGDWITPAQLPAELRPDWGQSAQNQASTCQESAHSRLWALFPRHEQADWRMDRMERRWIEAALEHTAGHQQRAADLLGLSRRTLSRKLRDWGANPVAEPRAE